MFQFEYNESICAMRLA